MNMASLLCEIKYGHRSVAFRSARDCQRSFITAKLRQPLIVTMRFPSFWGRVFVPLYFDILIISASRTDAPLLGEGHHNTLTISALSAQEVPLHKSIFSIRPYSLFSFLFGHSHTLNELGDLTLYCERFIQTSFSSFTPTTGPSRLDYKHSPFLILRREHGDADPHCFT